MKIGKNLIQNAFLFFFSLLLNSGIAQDFCLTPANSNFSGAESQIANMNESGPFFLKIYVHVIRQSNGTGGQSNNEVDEALLFLDQDFNPHNIFFVWDCQIDYIDNDAYFDSPSGSIFNINSHTDGIDVYLYNDHLQPSPSGNGLANGIGSSAFYVFGNYWEAPHGSLVRSHVISHEMGHCLNLWHTWQGPNGCAELVDGSNCNGCGDLVCDSPASPGLGFNVDPNTCDWLGSGTDSNGDAYMPNEAIIMEYSHPDCMSYFTDGQGQRMRNSINTLAVLQATITMDDPSPCNCTDIYNLTTTINTPIKYEADNYITASNTILGSVNTGNGVQYDAANYVELTTGFHAQQGCVFEAFIDGCLGFRSSNSIEEDTANDVEESMSNSSETLALTNYPNPFGQSTTIEYKIVEPTSVNLRIFNTNGQLVTTLVEDEFHEKGIYQKKFNRDHLPNGIYFLQINTANANSTKRMFIQK